MMIVVGLVHAAPSALSPDQPPLYLNSKLRATGR